MDWTFPHENLPLTFTAIASRPTERAPRPSSKLSGSVTQRDPTCIISDYGDGLTNAHLCPKTQQTWFDTNGMSNYCLDQFLAGPYRLDDVSNAFSLRHDIHDVFDDQKFAFVPHGDEWRVHFFAVTNTLGRLYHNKPTQTFQVDKAFILVRLAWTIFPLVRAFLQGGPDRRVKVRIRSENNTSKEEVVTKTREQLIAEHPPAQKVGSKPESKRSAATPTGSEEPRKRTSSWVLRTAEEREWFDGIDTLQTISRQHRDILSSSTFSLPSTCDSSAPDDALSDLNVLYT